MINSTHNTTAVPSATGGMITHAAVPASRRCGNSCIRQEALADLLGGTIDAIEIPAAVAEQFEQALQASQSEADQDHRDMRERVERQHRALVSKLDRGYDDYVEGRISEDFWTRKSRQWEDERWALEADIGRLDRSSASLVLPGQKVLELAKQAGFLYRTQDPTEQRRLLDTVLSNCTFNRGSLCPTYNKPFDLFVRGNETGNWRRGWDSNPRAGTPTASP